MNFTEFTFSECYQETCSSVSIAAREGLVNQLASLIKRDDCDINWQTFEGETALILASRADRVEAVQTLIQAGACARTISKSLMSALHEAVGNNSQPCTEALMETNVNIDQDNFTGDTALKIAAENGYDSMVEILLQHNAKIGIKDCNGLTAIFAAAHKGHTSCLELLIKAAVDRGESFLIDTVSDDNATPVYLAAQEGHVDCLSLLLKHGANPNTLTRDDPALPLMAAIEFQRIECLKMLLPVTNRNLFSRCFIHPLGLAVSILEPRYSDGDPSQRPLIMLLEQGICDLHSNNTDDSTHLERYSRWPWNYDGQIPVHLCRKISRSPEYLRLVRSYIPELQASSPHSVPPAIPLVCCSVETWIGLLKETPNMFNCYTDNIVGNATILEVVFTLVNEGSFQREIFMKLCILILYGVDIKSCLDIFDLSYNEQDWEYSIVSVYNMYYGAGQYKSMLYELLSGIIPLCGFLHLGDNWRRHLSHDQWWAVKHLEAQSQTLFSLCRGKITIDLIKSHGFSRVNCLDIPAHIREHFIRESTWTEVFEYLKLCEQRLI